MTLADPRVFYRVRAKAAQLLASHCYNASTNFQAGHALLHFFKSRYFGAGMFQLKPNDFSDLSAYFVQKAVIRAVAQLRDAEGLTPVGGGAAGHAAVELLLELLQWNNNESNTYCDACYLANILHAVTLTRALGPHHRAPLRAMRAEVLRYLQREMVLPSPRTVVGVAAVGALAHVDCCLAATATRKPAEEGSSKPDPGPAAGGGGAETVDCKFYASCLQHTAHAVRAGRLHLGIGPF
jgi:hypothetical protein